MTNRINPDERYGFADLNGAAMITGLSRSTLYKLVAQRKIPHYKPTGRLLFKIEELKIWIEQGKCDTVSRG